MTRENQTMPCTTVVVVEDDVLVREIAVAELEDSGFQVVGFASADEALPYLRRHGAEAGLMLTDVQMPGTMNGLQLADIVSRLCPRLPILVMSGGSTVDPARLPTSARFLRKPWHPLDMVARVRSLADSSVARQAASRVSTSLSQ
jgi:FixJ family two-component response regulator